jgi:hypothetical protein
VVVFEREPVVVEPERMGPKEQAIREARVGAGDSVVEPVGSGFGKVDSLTGVEWVEPVSMTSRRETRGSNKELLFEPAHFFFSSKFSSLFSA